MAEPEQPNLHRLIDSLNIAGLDTDAIAELLADQMGENNVDYILEKVAEARPSWLARLQETDHDRVAQAQMYGYDKERERRRRRIKYELDAEERSQEGLGEARYADGGAFIHDIPAVPPSLWGTGNQVVWMKGEALMIVGPPGVGKTTLTAQVVKARLVGGKVLGMEVEPGERVLYLAMDRPQQIARALARTLRDVPRDLLAERFVPWEGPPPGDFAANPEAMLRMARQQRADTIVVDSLKDAAIGLTNDEVGGGYNRARQMCLANDVEVIELHHNVKRGADGRPPNSLEDVYGSRWLTAGAGSVVFLHGKPGDPVVRWLHLKQPAEEVGPFDVTHDHALGLSQVYGALDLVELANAAGKDGVTAEQVARLMFEKSKPDKSERMKAMRRLDALARDGRVGRVDGDAATKQPTRWVSEASGTAWDEDGEGLI
ncbi:AAA family ATPase [Nocardioides aurantiacus]|uniref:Replicative DNA helicase n=1 Tax=Nocardioides aurantiacus TaxID=86796 RepID=A0A3N2CP86_9ACTN|nr:AAA family ATPase [Nocardioides aurantiacus]ROR89333.1 replicative DNA helicase [Nocardioides aurantiacus]